MKYRVCNYEFEWIPGSGIYHQIGSLVDMQPAEAMPYLAPQCQPPHLEEIAVESPTKPPPNIEEP